MFNVGFLKGCWLQNQFCSVSFPASIIQVTQQVLDQRYLKETAPLISI
jgi:hypothetical protein